MTEASTEGLQVVKETALQELRETALLGRKDKASVYLVSRGVKPTGIVELHFEPGHESYTQQDFALGIQSLGELLYNLDLPYKYNHQVDEDSYERGEFLFGKDEQSLQKLLDAYEEETCQEKTLTIGRALGYPDTAIQGIITQQKLLPSEYPDELASDEAAKFAIFTLSKDHWREEMEIVRGYAEEVKITNPMLYQVIVGKVV